MIRKLPPVPECRLSARLPARPEAIHLQPGGIALDKWKYEEGRLEARIPGFAVHQMVVARLPE